MNGLVASEVNRAAKYFFGERSEGSSLKALDLCMAPGGYSSFFLNHYKGSTVTAITLPVKMGGNQVLIPHNTDESRLSVSFLDVSKLGDEAERALLPFDLVPQFDHIFCDGQYLVAYTKHKYGDAPTGLWKEPLLLSLSQLIIALETVKDGGSMMVLGHRCWTRRNTELLVRFNSFARVMVFKSWKAWPSTASYYMLISGIRRGKELENLRAELQKEWYETRDGPVVRVPASQEKRDFMVAKYETLLRDHGRFLIKVCERSWTIMADGLVSKLKWAKREAEELKERKTKETEERETEERLDVTTQALQPVDPQCYVDNAAKRSMWEREVSDELDQMKAELFAEWESGDLLSGAPSGALSGLSLADDGED